MVNILRARVTFPADGSIGRPSMPYGSIWLHGISHGFIWRAPKHIIMLRRPPPHPTRVTVFIHFIKFDFGNGYEHNILGRMFMFNSAYSKYALFLREEPLFHVFRFAWVFIMFSASDACVISHSSWILPFSVCCQKKIEMGFYMKRTQYNFCFEF